MKKNIVIILLLCVALFSIRCVCGGGAPAVIPTPPPTIAYLQFPTNTGLVSPNSPYWIGSEIGYVNFGLSNKQLEGDGFIKMRFSSADNEDAILGFNASATSENYTNFEVYAWVSGGILYTGENGGSTSSGGSIASGTYIRIIRSGSMFKAQKSANDTTWTDVRTYSYSSSATMYICTAILGNRTLAFPTGYGLTDYTGGSSIGRTLDTLVVCDGNSLTASNYPVYLRNYLSNKSSVVSYGVGGQTTAQMAADAATQYDIYYNASRVNILVAWEVGNDIYANGSASDAYTRFAAFCNARRAVGWIVIASTCPPRINVNDVILQSANSLLISNQASYCNKLLNARSDSRLATITNTYWSSDSVHLNNTGYDVFATLIKSKIIE